MPQKVLRFTGINRKANEFNSQGTCEELVNLRPEVGGFSVVKPKKELPSMGSYSFIYEHSFGATNNIVAVTKNGNVVLVNEYEEIYITSFDSSDGISMCSAGNVLFIYSKSSKIQKAFKFDNDEYKSYNVTFNRISGVEVLYDYDYSINDRVHYTVNTYDKSKTAINDAINLAVSGFYSNNSYWLSGAVVVGFTYELEDGNEVASTAFTVVNPYRVMKQNMRPNISSDGTQLTVYGVKGASLYLTFDGQKPEGVRRINAYVSRPIPLYQAESYVEYTPVDLNDVQLANQLLYYHKSIDATDGLDASIELEFKASQAGEKIMDVTSGCVTRIGEAVSYNNRFHFFNSEEYHSIQAPTVSCVAEPNSGGAEIWVPYVEIKDKLIRTNTSYWIKYSDVNDFIYPLAGVKKMIFFRAEPDSSGRLDIKYDSMFTVELKDSGSYNYSYAFDAKTTTSQVPSDLLQKIKDSGQYKEDPLTKTVFLKDEYNAINVSAQYNPFVFDVKHSYAFSGNVLDVETAYTPISATQIGQYPISVFTTNGIFSLEQGSGTSLYGNIIPIQPLVIDGKSKATPYGTFFISSKNLYLLNGREAISVSDMMKGKLDMEIRNAGGYSSLIYGDESYFGELLSDIDFESFIAHAVLTYDPLQNELIISSDYRYEELGKGQNYSYVFNFNTKAFHKIAGQLLPSQNGAKYVLEYNNGNTKLLNLTEEVETDPIKVMLQSRPFSYEAFYTHINRLIMLTDANLSNGRTLAISVFGSDNLHDWRCIISAQKKNTVLRQIRTNRAAKSYRDYVILITGCVNTDTDISDIIADYSVVNRKLG